MKTIITTVGTSLFENYMNSEVRNLFNNEKEEYEDISGVVQTLKDRNIASAYNSKGVEEVKIKNSIKGLWLKDITRKKRKWIFEKGNNKYASAELESILMIKEALQEFTNVHLLATDTILSRLACEIIREFLMEQYSGRLKVHFNSNIDVIQNLRVDDYEKFKNGLILLTDRFYQIGNNQLRAGLSQDIILNITGGYKGIIPYFSLLGQINRTKIQYTFEDTGVLLTIPQVPIKEDIEMFEKHWKVLNKLDSEILNRHEYQQVYEDLSVCFDLDGDEFCFNFLGEALWKKYLNQFFIFYSPDYTWEEIEKQKDIKRILSTKLWNPQIQNGVKNEHKGDKRCYDDGNNNNRIYNLKKGNKFYIYKTFENEETAKVYINEKVDFEKIIELSKERKIKKRNTN